MKTSKSKLAYAGEYVVTFTVSFTTHTDLVLLILRFLWLLLDDDKTKHTHLLTLDAVCFKILLRFFTPAKVPKIDASSVKITNRLSEGTSKAHLSLLLSPR